MICCRYAKIVIWRLSQNPLQNVNVQNDLLLDGVLTSVTALDKHRDMGRMFIWSQAIKAARLKSNAIGLFFYQVIKFGSETGFLGFSLIILVCWDYQVINC